MWVTMRGQCVLPKPSKASQPTTYRWKYPLILSSVTFSGKSATHRYLVSRTMIEIPSFAGTYRWRFHIIPESWACSASVVLAPSLTMRYPRGARARSQWRHVWVALSINPLSPKPNGQVRGQERGPCDKHNGVFYLYKVYGTLTL